MPQEGEPRALVAGDDQEREEPHPLQRHPEEERVQHEAKGQRAEPDLILFCSEISLPSFKNRSHTI